MAATPDTVCYGAVCFVRIWQDEQKFFGFGEYLAAVAVIALAWTTADFRYKFRVATAPMPLERITFGVVTLVGLLTLLTDLWRARGWYVPAGHLMTPAGWQAFLGAVFFGNFIAWVWFAFVRPARYGRMNDERFAATVYRVLLKGSSTEVPEVADELVRSIPALIANSWTNRDEKPKDLQELRGRERTRQYAYEILLMLGNRKFCRHVVQSSPITAMALFEEMRRQKRYQPALSSFARNFTTEVISNKDSFAYHESSVYEGGLFGHVKPLTTSIYGNCDAVAATRSLFDVDFDTRRSWNSEQWKAYGKLVITTLHDCVKRRGAGAHLPEIDRAIGMFEGIGSGIHVLNGANDWKSDELSKLQVAADFAHSCIEALTPLKGEGYQWLRIPDGRFSRDIYDVIAGLIFELILAASAVSGPRDLCWWIQHNIVWYKFFNRPSDEQCASKVVLFKLRRLLFDELKTMDTFPNFKGTRILSLMLNVLTFDERGKMYRSEYPLRRAVLSWTRKNFARIWNEGNPELGKSMLVDSITYDEDAHTLVYTRPARLSRDGTETLLQVEPYTKGGS